MKRFLILALGCLFLCASAHPASANGWGLTGGVLNIVSATDTYDEYTAIADDGHEYFEGMVEGIDLANHAVLESRYHRVLISAIQTGGEWIAQAESTQAVYQPDDPRGKTLPRLEQNDKGVGVWELSYGEGESYLFDAHGYLLEARWVQDANTVAVNGWSSEDGYLLETGRAKNAQSTVTIDGWSSGSDYYGMWVSHPENSGLPIGEAHWYTDGITIGEFNIAQMPRSLAEVRHINTVAGALRAYAPALAVQFVLPAVEDGARLPVYAMPDTDAYRAGDGKALVSLGGEIEVLGRVGDWSLIQYEVSARRRRIGYVPENLGGGPLEFANVPLTAAADTFLTDDPFVSQKALFQIPAGTPLTGLAQCGEFYAYVESVQDGAPVRGFVPLKDLMTTYDMAVSTEQDYPTADVRWDLMDTLVGKWGYLPDGERLILYADGSWRNHLPGDGPYFQDMGNYRIYDGPEEDYLLVLRTEYNEEHTYILWLNGDGSITLRDDAHEFTLWRQEYSTYGNG